MKNTRDVRLTCEGCDETVSRTIPTGTEPKPFTCPACSADANADNLTVRAAEQRKLACDIRARRAKRTAEQKTDKKAQVDSRLKALFEDGL